MFYLEDEQVALAWFQEGGGAKLWLGPNLVQDDRERRDISRHGLMLGGLFEGSDVDYVRWRWRVDLLDLRRRLWRCSERWRFCEELGVTPLAVAIDVIHLAFADHDVFARALKEFFAVVGQHGQLDVLAKLPGTEPDVALSAFPILVGPFRRIVRLRRCPIHCFGVSH